MQRKLSWGAIALGAGLGFWACGGDDDDQSRAVLENYAAVVHASYSESIIRATAMKTALDAYAAAPSTATLAAAKTAWIAARTPYGQTEVYRFYNGPIDNETDGPEGQINAWPLDENYVDYVVGAPTSGIINNPTQYPTLNESTLASLNEQGGEANVATGYHAIEFLLWGQDLNSAGPGNRPFTDFVPGGTAANQARRAQYLRAATNLLIADLESVRDAWAPAQANNYRAEFVELDAEEGLRRMLLGMGNLGGAELAGERMTVAYDTKEQEDEHSCFSDNTLADLLGNQVGIQNVYLGRFGSVDGPGIDVLVREKDAALDTRFQQQLSASISALQAIPAPFDQAIQGADTAPGRVAVRLAIDRIQQQTETVVEIAELLGVQINIEKPVR